jgi:Tfp pilus assembly protein PilF
MRKVLLKALLKMVLTLVVIVSVCELTGFQSSETSEKKSTTIAKPTTSQYIPPHLDYSEMIKAIKAEEGIEEEAEDSTEVEKEEPQNFDYMITKEEEPYDTKEYMTMAKECVQEAIRTTDENRRIRNVRKALECYLRYLKYYEGDLDALLGAGSTATYLGKENQARHLLMEAFATYPKNPNVHKALGDYCYKFNKFNNAIEYYNLSLESGNIQDYNTNIATAVCYEKLGDIEKAIEYFRVAQHLNPDSKIANERLEMYEKMERDGYQTDSRLYDTSGANDENKDVELETLILDSQRIK